METVSLGRTGLKVSKFCLGTMTLGSSDWQPWALDEAESRPILKRALDCDSRQIFPTTLRMPTFSLSFRFLLVVTVC